MKTYLSDIVPKLKQYSQKLDNLTLLTNQHWVIINDIENTKQVYIFRQGGELLISQNGKVSKAKWEYLGNNSLLIEMSEDCFLFKHGFFDENILALKIDSKEEYAFLVNENRYEGELNSINKVMDFLNENYIRSDVAKILSEPNIELDIQQGKSKAPPYSIVSSKKQGVWFDRFTEYTIKFEDELIGRYNLGFSGYYFLDEFDLKLYFPTKEIAIDALYELLKTGKLFCNGRIYQRKQ